MIMTCFPFVFSGNTFLALLFILAMNQNGMRYKVSGVIGHSGDGDGDATRATGIPLICFNDVVLTTQDSIRENNTSHTCCNEMC